MNKQTPAYLFVGSTKETDITVLEFIQKQLCPNACGTCKQCLLIADKQHFAVEWIEPDKRYVLSNFDTIFERIQLVLEPNQHVFFVIKKADFLSTACANALLKIVEEPPEGYHFLFTAKRLVHVLPTIRSRCVIQTLKGTSGGIDIPMFLQSFLAMHGDPQVFLKELASANISEQDSIEHLDTLLELALREYKKALEEDSLQAQQQALKKITLYQAALEKPPMPGSTKLFWKNLYLQK